MPRDDQYDVDDEDLTDDLEDYIEERDTREPGFAALVVVARIAERERQRNADQPANPEKTDLDALVRRADEQSVQGKVYDLDTIL